MTSDKFYQGPNIIHPERESAVGSRNSLHRDGRNEYNESKLLIDEEVEKILSHVEAKLPPEVLEKLHIGGTVKELLHNYFNQAFHNMYNRYLVTAEDELSKKFRSMIDQEETKGLNKHAPKQISELLDSLGGAANFNNQDLESSIVSIYSQLQSHLQKGVYDLQKKTSQVLQEKAEVSGLVNTDFTYSLVNCHIADNPLKPETVTDVSMVINILESELLSPIFHFQATTESIIKDVISTQILERVDEEIEQLKQKLSAQGEEKITEAEEVFEKFRKLENYVDFENTPESPQYSFVAKDFFEKIEGIGSEILKDSSYDPLNIRENLQRIVDEGKLRTRGFNKAVNALTNYLDNNQLGYQHIENFKNARKVHIAEYGDTDAASLPDERYAISLTYYDNEQIRTQRRAYAAQISELQQEVDTLWNVFDQIGAKRREKAGNVDFQVLSQIYSQGPPPPPSFFERLLAKFFKTKRSLPKPSEGDKVKLWDEAEIIKPKETVGFDLDNTTYTFNPQKQYITTKLKLLSHKISESFGAEINPQRQILQDRLEFLEANFEDFLKGYNPFNVRPGLFLELRLSTVAKKKTTMRAMGEVLNDFLGIVAKGFVDISGQRPPNSAKTTEEAIAS